MNKDLFIKALTQQSKRKLLQAIDDCMDSLQFQEKVNIPTNTVVGRMFYRKPKYAGGICIVEYQTWFDENKSESESLMNFFVGRDYLGNEVSANCRVSPQSFHRNQVQALYNKLRTIPKTLCFHDSALEFKSEERSI